MLACLLSSAAGPSICLFMCDVHASRAGVLCYIVLVVLRDTRGHGYSAFENTLTVNTHTPPVFCSCKACGCEFCRPTYHLPRMVTTPLIKMSLSKVRAKNIAKSEAEAKKA